MGLMADQVIATTNQGYINSKIPLRAVLHCIEETNEPESAFTLDNRDQGRLGYFRQYKDGGNSLRGSADAAVLIVKDAQGVCGVGYKLRDASNYDDWMVSLTELSCALGGYTFGHELGHNMGLDHDKYADATRNTPYSQGYHLPGTKYRTILAYTHGEHRLRANHYSNPRVNFLDVPTGDADSADRDQVCHRCHRRRVGDLRNPSSSHNNSRPDNNTNNNHPCTYNSSHHYIQLH